MQKILVIGGGVVGLSCAVTLAHAGHAVTVLESRTGREAASWGNAGHIATEQVAPLASPTALVSVPRRLFAAGGALDLPLRSVAQWLPFAARMLAASTPAHFAAGTQALTGLLIDALPAWERLTTAIGRPDLLRANGHFVAWESARSAASGRRNWAAADTGTASFTDAAAIELAQLQMLTGGRVAGAIRFSGTGQITDLASLAGVLEHALLAAGGQLVRQSATLRRTGSCAFVDGFDADAILVAAGVSSGALMRGVGHAAPVIAERGYHIRASAPRWPGDLPPVVFEDRSMIVTRYGATLQAASFVEFAAADAPPDPRKWQRLERHVAELALPVEGPFTRWMGARPTLPDYLPAIGRSHQVNNLIYAFGHQHLGLTLAPVTADIVAALVRGEASPLELAPFRIERFGRTSA